MMENGGLSIADALAMAKDNDGFNGTGGWLWFLIVMFAISGNGFGFGNNKDVATSTQVQNGFDNQNIMSRFDMLAENQARNAMDNMSLIDRNAMENSNLINQARFDNMQNIFGITQAMNEGFNAVNNNLCGISHQISDGVCEIKTQMLQDKYDKLLNDYNLSTMANANSVQTQNILGAIGSWYAKPPINPYYGYTGTQIGG